jgi:hypothetical protein
MSVLWTIIPFAGSVTRDGSRATVSGLPSNEENALIGGGLRRLFSWCLGASV